MRTDKYIIYISEVKYTVVNKLIEYNVMQRVWMETCDLRQKRYRVYTPAAFTRRYTPLHVLKSNNYLRVNERENVGT